MSKMWGGTQLQSLNPRMGNSKRFYGTISEILAPRCRFYHRGGGRELNQNARRLRADILDHYGKVRREEMLAAPRKVNLEPSC